LARTNQLKAWNEMARQVAHEIKNPLTPVQLAAEHLQRVHLDHGEPLGDVVGQCVRTILSQVRLLRQIASEFANFAGTPTPRPESVDLAGLIEAVVKPYVLGLAEHVQFAQHVASSLPTINADRTLLARAITNLIENAVQAMPDGGTLTVRAEPDGPTHVHLIVSDTGIGMDDVAQARAFEPYFSTKTSGSGLGLANARRNIEISGGTIALSSRIGAGTEVIVRLPVASAAQPSAPATW
jgi:nitrogen fixation/metabolism regulation signal transduction histidine kinase